MMKRLIYIAALAVGSSSCSILELDESQGMTKEQVYHYFEGVNKIVNNIYGGLPNELGGFKGALRESATDNSTYVWDSNDIRKFFNGSWSPISPIDNSWKNLYASIEAANSFLANYSPESLKKMEWQSNYKKEMKKVSMFSYEVRVLRAFYFFELAKRYGDIQMPIKCLSVEEANLLPRTPFEKVIEFIVDECDECANELPINQSQLFEETGRVTKGVAMAVKARALLYAASKLHNPTGDKTKWERAAKASLDIINLNVYQLESIDNDPFYKFNGLEMLSSKQLIFSRREAPLNSFESENLPISMQGGNTGNTPTQNLVEAFEKKDGTKVDWANLKPGEDPYKDLDPRFKANIVYNGETYFNTKIEAAEGEKDSKTVNGGSQTGYYLRKYVNTQVSLDPTKPSKAPHCFFLYRYAEVLLNYAEAMNEWKDADYKDDSFTLSAREALNKVRDAARMPNVTAVGDEFTDRLRAERRVELAFENHRFWDVRRWMIASEKDVNEIRGIKITKTDDGEYVYRSYVIENRIWNDKMYLYPIPKFIMNIKGNSVVQNPGW